MQKHTNREVLTYLSHHQHDIDNLKTVFPHLPNWSRKPVIICGPKNSGKSTLAETLAALFDFAHILNFANYEIQLSHIPLAKDYTHLFIVDEVPTTTENSSSEDHINEAYEYITKQIGNAAASIVFLTQERDIDISYVDSECQIIHLNDDRKIHIPK